MRIPLPKQYHKTIDLKYKGKKIRTYVFGRGKKQVLSLPAFPQSGLIYLYLLLHYNLDKVRFISFDLPGWIGESENIYTDSTYSEDDTLDLVRSVIKYYELKNFSVIGFSFGSTLATRIYNEFSEVVEKLVLVSPVLSGISVDDKLIRSTLKLVKKYNAYDIAKQYVLIRFKYYKKYLRTTGMESSVIDQYYKMVKKVDSKVLFTSLEHLYSSDYSKYLTKLKDRNVMIVSSINELPYFRKQAGHIRHILDGEKNLYLRGNHEDFVLKPKADNVKQVMDFLVN